VNVGHQRAGDDLEGYTARHALDLWTLFNQADPFKRRLRRCSQPDELRAQYAAARYGREHDNDVAAIVDDAIWVQRAERQLATRSANTQFYVTTHATSPDLTPWGDAANRT
jgi:hypothetical protein